MLFSSLVLFFVARPAATTKAPTATSKSSKPVKPTKPADIDCDKNHHVSPRDDNNLDGVLLVNSCKSSRFTSKPSRCSSVADKFTSLLNGNLAKLGIKDQHQITIQQTLGNDTCTEFHYTCPCAKAEQQSVMNSLQDSCKDKDFTDTVTQVKQCEEGESSSESSEETTTSRPATKVTQKDAPQTHSTAAPTTRSSAAPGTQACKEFYTNLYRIPCSFHRLFFSL